MRISALLGFSLAALLLSLSTTAHAAPADSVWIQLFDKSDTNFRKDWDVKIRGAALNVDTRRTFRYAINGADTSLEVNYSGYTNFSNAPDAGGSAQETFGHAAYKHRPFSYYILRSEYQVWGSQPAGSPGWANQNNGFMLHSQPMTTMTINQDFPISLEAQLLGPANTTAGGGSVSASTMNICTPGTAYYRAPAGGSVYTDHCTPSRQGLARAAANTGWQKVSALILGDSLHRYFTGPNGNDSALTFYRPVYYSGNVTNPPSGTPANGTRLTGGYITIQGESAPYRFRKIELLNLEGCMTVTDANYKSYLLKHDSTACAGSTGIKGTSPADARYAAPMTFIGNAVKVGGAERVTLEVFDMTGVRVGSRTAQAPFQWSPAVKQSGMHVIRAITPKGTYTEKIALF